MPIWNRLRQATQDMQSQLVSKKNELQSGAFRDASMAMCALVAAADGTHRRLRARRRSPASSPPTRRCRTSRPRRLRSTFESNCAKLTADYQLGKVELVQVVGKTKKKPAEARAVIQIGIIIGGADGNFDDQEKAVVRECCHAVGIDPSEFEL